jgi:CHAT domain-containing protein/tetratricopeptide (TPR) repeat protein
MPLSHARNFDVRCPHCDETFQAEVWFIVDTQERPDLVARCVEGTLHTFLCPKGDTVRIGTSVLVVDRSQRRVLFCARDGMPPEIQEKEVESLVRQLHEGDGGCAGDGLDRVEKIPRRLLGMALKGKTAEDLECLDALLDSLGPGAGPRKGNIPELARRALRFLHREDDPLLWAGLQMVVGRDHRLREEGNPLDNLRQAAEALDAAVQVFTRDQFPIQHAAAHHELGKVWLGRAHIGETGGRGEHFLHARTCLDTAIEIYTRLADAEPAACLSELADACYDLGKVYWGEGNLPQARDAFAEAVRCHRQPREEGSVEATAALAQALSALGEIHDILHDSEAARACLAESANLYQQLAEQTPSRYQADLAFVLNDLAVAQAKLGDLVAARDAFARAADLFQHLIRHEPDHTFYQYDLGRALNGLVAAELKRLSEAPDQETLQRCRDQLEEAVRLFRGLVAQNPESYSAQLALALSNLGRVQRGLGDLDAALRAQAEAVARFQRSARPGEPSHLDAHASACLQLGLLHLAMNAPGQARPALEEAAACYRCLNELRPGEQDHLAAVLDLLGHVHDTLGDEETARACIEGALRIRSPAGEDQDAGGWARGQAVSLMNRSNIRRKMMDLRGALDDCLEAMTLLQQHADPRSETDAELVAVSCVNAGAVLLAQRRPDLAINGLEQAVDIYRRLSEGSSRYLADLALALVNLGTAHMLRGDAGTARANLQESLVLRRLRADRDPERCLLEVASTLHNLGVFEAGVGNLPAARERYEEAIEVYGAAAAISKAARAHELFACWFNLSTLYLPEPGRESWDDPHRAREALRQAVSHGETSRGRFLSVAQRRRVLGETIQAYERLIEVCVRLGKEDSDEGYLREAVTAAEASRARMLTELLADEGSRPANVPADLAERFDRARRLLRESDSLLFQEERGAGLDLEEPSGVVHVASNSLSPALALLGVRGAGGPGSADTEALKRGRVEWRRRETARLRCAYEELLAEVRQLDPQFDPDVVINPVSHDEVRSLLPADQPTAVIQFVLTDEGGYAFVIEAAATRVVELPALSSPAVADLARRWVDARQRTRAAGAATPEQALAHRLAWEANLAEHLTALSAMVTPLLDALVPRGIGRLIVAPHRSLHLFPLHACPAGPDRHLLDEYEFVYAPSLSVLHACQRRRPMPAGPALLIQDPIGDLPLARVEGECVRGHHGNLVALAGGAATRERVLGELGACGLLHYAGHGLFDEDDPLSSALVLEGWDRPGSWLLLRDVMCEVRMPGNRLTILSGCETGLQNPDVMDEAVHFPLGFLYAGASCVISTLWEVDDLSAALLLDRFHAECSVGLAPATALKKAQLWLRDEITSGEELREAVIPLLVERISDEALRAECRDAADFYATLSPTAPPFRSPLHWAPFIATGRAYPVDVTPSG